MTHPCIVQRLSPFLIQESGNRMTEENLAMIIGPNILHKDIKVCVCVFRCEGSLLHVSLSSGP